MKCTVVLVIQIIKKVQPLQAIISLLLYTEERLFSFDVDKFPFYVKNKVVVHLTYNVIQLKHVEFKTKPRCFFGGILDEQSRNPGWLDIRFNLDPVELTGVPAALIVIP